MLNIRQKNLLKAYGKAQLTLKSHAVVRFDFGDDDNGYLTPACDEMWNNYRYRGENHEIIMWMHPHIHPCWDEYDISEYDFSEYMHKRFSILYPNKN